MSGHTPGPWSVAPNGCCVFTDAVKEGRGVAMCNMAQRSPEEIAANVKLIAAAPELLEILIIALPYMETAKLDPAYKPGAVAKVVKQMGAVISKAGGLS